MKNKLVILIVIVAVISGAAFWINKSKEKPENSINNQIIDNTISQKISFENPKEYKSEKFRFSFKYPENFSITEYSEPISDIGEDEAHTILVQEKLSGKGIQIYITPFDEGNIDITEERIKQDIPEMRIENSQVLNVGSRNKGLAFESDNPSFGGMSREVWFVFNGNLYQISTYFELDEMLRNLFGTWKFE